MKILAATGEFPPFRGGISTYCADLATAVADLGWDIHVLAPDYDQDLAGSDLENFAFPVTRFKGDVHTPWDWPRKAKILAGFLRAHQSADVFHAMDNGFAVPGALVARRFPRLITVFGTDIFEMGSHARQKMALRLTRTFSRDTDVVAISEYTKNLFSRELYAVSTASVRYAHLGVSDFWAANASPALLTRRKYDIAEDNVVLLTVGRLTPRKGHLDTITALNELPPEIGRKLTYLIVGSSNEHDYKKAIADLAVNCQSNVRCLGNISNESLRDLYAASDLFVLTGNSSSSGKVEGFGLVYLEAAAQGLPALATDVGAVTEVVRHETTGLVVPEGNVAQIGASLKRLIADQLLRKRLAGGAKRFAAQFTWRACAENTYGPYC